MFLSRTARQLTELTGRFVYMAAAVEIKLTKFLWICIPREYFLNFMLIVRKEISGGKSKLTTDDILLNIMQSHEELRKYQVFCGFK